VELVRGETCLVDEHPVGDAVLVDAGGSAEACRARTDDDDTDLRSRKDRVIRCRPTPTAADIREFGDKAIRTSWHMHNRASEAHRPPNHPRFERSVCRGVQGTKRGWAAMAAEVERDSAECTAAAWASTASHTFVVSPPLAWTLFVHIVKQCPESAVNFYKA